jgi:(E)-4-hydroxy-3-methylbut-2-enyl-diphosphate synthase
VIADIHFDHRLALAAIRAGADAIRINPGNIGGKKKFKLILEAAQDAGICIRVGVNSGSLEKRLLIKYGSPTPDAMVESALGFVGFMENYGFTQYKISLKSSDVLSTISAYRLFSQSSDAPLHIGVTEAGSLVQGSVKSAIGIGMLLAEGIGDTIRVSLSAPPIHEVRAAYAILRTLRLRERGVEIISCPTCGRCGIELLPVVEEAERRLAFVKKPIKVAIMGCVVNGPGEAREADVGVAGGKGHALLFKRGNKVRRIKEEEMVDILVEEVTAMVSN